MFSYDKILVGENMKKFNNRLEERKLALDGKILGISRYKQSIQSICVWKKKPGGLQYEESNEKKRGRDSSKYLVSFVQTDGSFVVDIKT